jgi:hypothetical protein
MKKSKARIEKWVKRVAIVVVVLMFCLFLIEIYFVWSFATNKVSGEIDCSVKQIDYISLTEDKDGVGDCSFPLVSGNVTMCALPRDFHCRGTLQNFPIVRAFVEALK